MPNSDDLPEGNIFESRLYLDEKLRLESRLLEILNQELTIENISVFYQGITSSLIDFIDSVISAYENLRGVSDFVNPRELEDRALEFFNLIDLHEILDVAASKERSIKELIHRTVNIVGETDFDGIILPPDISRPGISHGTGEYTRSMLVERSTLLFYILIESFGNPEIVVASGRVDDGMVRKTSYIAVEIPSLDRLVLVSDETGNATYVIYTDAMSKMNISKEDLLAYTKTDLRILLAENPQLGKLLNTSSKLRQNLEASLSSQIEQPTLPQVITNDLHPMKGFLLNPEDNYYYAPIGFISRRFGIPKETIETFITRQESNMIRGRDLSGIERNLYRFDEQLQSTIDEYLQLPKVAIEGEDEGFLRNEGRLYGSYRAIASRLDLSRGFVEQVIDRNPQIPYLKGLSLGMKVSKLYDLEVISAILADHLNTPLVSQIEDGNNWRGFLLVNGKHYGSEHTIVGRIKIVDPENAISDKKVGRIIKSLGLEKIGIRGLNKVVEVGYEFEAVYEEHLRLQSLPKIETEGEFAGCWLNPEDNKYYCTKTYFITKAVVGQRAVDKAVERSRPKSLQGRNSIDKEITLYELDPVARQLGMEQ